MHAVHDLEQAEALIRDHGFVPRLVVCDYRLRSGMHGTDVVLGHRNLLGQAVPSIIVTADTDPKLIAQIRERGFPVLIKPVSPPRLRVLMHNPGLRARAGPPGGDRAPDPMVQGDRRIDSDRQHAAADRPVRR